MNADQQALQPAAGEITAARGRQIYRQITGRKYLIMASLAIVLGCTLVLDISLGPARLSLWEVVSTMFMPGSAELTTRVIVWDIRMPIALVAVLVGAALSIAGAEMQTILNNPLASPFTLEISAAAGFGAALALVLGLSVIPFAGIFLVSANAFVFAMIASMTIFVLSGLRGVTVETMVLLGIALVFMFSSLLALMQYIASEQALQQVVFWTLGSLVKATWPKIGIAALVLLVITPLFVKHVWTLTALRLGDDKAHSLGINVRKLRLQVLISVSVLAAAAVAFVGTIADSVRRCIRRGPADERARGGAARGNRKLLRHSRAGNSSLRHASRIPDADANPNSDRAHVAPDPNAKSCPNRHFGRGPSYPDARAGTHRDSPRPLAVANP